MTPVFNELIVKLDTPMYVARYLVKRRVAMWGHNYSRDSQVDGASMTPASVWCRFLRRSLC